MTYNLKFASPTFKPPWEARRDMQVDMIRQYSPDIIGTQEGLKEQIDYLMDHLPEYVVIGEGRKGGDDDEHMATNNALLLKDSIAGGRGIDWILYRGDVKAVHYENVDYNVDGAYPSDHKPIFVRFRMISQ